jgi:hypothetical protein
VGYVNAEHATIQTLPEPIVDSAHELLVELARDVAWLLNREHSTIELETMHQCFVSLLISRNLASRNGLVKRKLLIRSIRECYTLPLLNALQCNFDEDKSGNWPALILSHLKKSSVNHPLRYLLLAHLLGHTAESFFGMCMDAAVERRRMPAPFGRAPWPCLNLTCANYRKPVIEAYEPKSAQRYNLGLTQRSKKLDN